MLVCLLEFMVMKEWFTKKTIKTFYVNSIPGETWDVLSTVHVALLGSEVMEHVPRRDGKPSSDI